MHGQPHIRFTWNVVMYIPNLVKIGWVFKKLKRRHRRAHRVVDDKALTLLIKGGKVGSTSRSMWTLLLLNKYFHRTLGRFAAFPDSIFRWRKRYLCRRVMHLQILCDMTFWVRWIFILWCWGYGTLMLNKDTPAWCHLLYCSTIYCSTCFECYYILI